LNSEKKEWLFGSKTVPEIGLVLNINLRNSLCLIVGIRIRVAVMWRISYET